MHDPQDEPNSACCEGKVEGKKKAGAQRVSGIEKGCVGGMMDYHGVLFVQDKYTD